MSNEVYFIILNINGTSGEETDEFFKNIVKKIRYSKFIYGNDSWYNTTKEKYEEFNNDLLMTDYYTIIVDHIEFYIIKEGSDYLRYGCDEFNEDLNEFIRKYGHSRFEYGNNVLYRNNVINYKACKEFFIRTNYYLDKKLSDKERKEIENDYIIWCKQIVNKL